MPLSSRANEAPLSLTHNFSRVQGSPAPAVTASAVSFMKKVYFLLIATFACFCLSATAQTLSYPDLVKRLTDLEALATLPVPGEKCAQWSSYDRKSRYDAATGKYIDWDANGDGNGIIRKEAGKLVFAEMEGPGCIWRIWSAAPKEGHVRIYLDGASEPAVDLPFIGYFDGKNAPFTRPAIVHMVARGWNNYTLIPYQKSCKIVADPGWGDYYHFTYSTFSKGTQLPTFKRQLTVEENAALDQASLLLRASGPHEDNYKSSVGGKSGALISDETTDTASLDGPAAITSIRIKADLPSGPAAYDALRSIILQIRWDGESEPSVWSPFGGSATLIL